MVLGLTGGIASGKSTVLNIFQRLGATTCDADTLTRQVTNPHSTPWQHILQYFSNDILSSNFTLNRNKLRQIAFNNKKILAILELIIHPYIVSKLINFINNTINSYPNKLIVIDIPLLIEANLISLVDKIVVVYASIENQIERLKKRDKIWYLEMT